MTSYGPEPTLCVECQRSFGLFRPEPVVHAVRKDGPPWGVLEALGLLLASLLALVAAEIGPVIYVVVAARAGNEVPTGEAYMTDPTLTLVRVCAAGVAHVVTFALAWWVVTNGRREPFFQNLGWGWRKGFGRATVFVAFAGIFLTNLALVQLFQQLEMMPKSTPFDRLLEVPSTRVAISIFAVVSAPFVEEVVFRGVLYPAVERWVGRLVAIVVVSGLFLLVHADQYGGSIAYLLPIGLLSVVLTALRAYSGSVLPSFALHLLFNSVQVALIWLTSASKA